MGISASQVQGACPRRPWGDAPTVPSQGHGHLGRCRRPGLAFGGHLGLCCAELDAEHTGETQRGFVLGPELLNCSRCFAAAQQFVI